MSGQETYSLFPPSFLNNEAVTVYSAVCIGEWSEMALLWLEGKKRRWEPGWTEEGVRAPWAKGNDTGCAVISILLSEAVESNMLPPSSLFPS